MKIGYHLGYWAAGPPPDAAELVRAVEDLGFDSLWTAEAYGSDCLTPLAWWGSTTSRVRLATNIMQLSARTPAAAAMAAMTMDHLSGGRFVLGLGVSGPQVVEGWYGQPYPKPLARTREYVEVLRAVMAREKPVQHAGEQYQLPFTEQAGRVGTGLGKPLRSTLHPVRPSIPILLGAEGPKNVALAAEIGDGWLPLFFSPKSDRFYRDALAEGFARPGARHSEAVLGGTSEEGGFEVAASVPVVIADDVEAAADQIRPTLALYIGGMGARGTNFHLDVFARMGWESVCEQVQDAYLDGRKADAIAAIPTELAADVALLGPPAAVRDQLDAWDSTIVTTLLVQAGNIGGSPLEGVQRAAEVLLS